MAPNSTTAGPGAASGDDSGLDAAEAAGIAVGVLLVLTLGVLAWYLSQFEVVEGDAGEGAPYSNPTFEAEAEGGAEAAADAGPRMWLGGALQDEVYL